MTALPKASGRVEDHPPSRKTLNCGRFLWISAAEKNTSPGEAKTRGKTRSKGEGGLSKEVGVVQSISSEHLKYPRFLRPQGEGLSLLRHNVRHRKML